MNEWIIVVAIVTLSAVLAGVGGWLSRRTLTPSSLTDAIPSAAAIFATFGVIYGVILGQVVVAAWQAYDNAENAIAREADSLVSIARLADGLPADDRMRVQQASIAYGNTVVEQEWPVMAGPGGASPEAGAALTSLYRIVTALPGDSPEADAIADAALAELDDLDDARGDRIVASTSSMPTLMWIALIAGAIVSVAFTYLLAVENGALHLLMIVCFAGLIALMLVLVLGLSQPFDPPLAITSDSYARRIDLLQNEVQGSQ